MGDKNPIRTLRDYSKSSHEGYRNTIELSVGNNVELRYCAQCLIIENEDFVKEIAVCLYIRNLLDLDGANKERTRMRLFQFSLRYQASNWLERLLVGSITTWEDLTTRFLAQFFLPGRTVKLRNDILMFQKHHGESLSEAWNSRPAELLKKILIKEEAKFPVTKNVNSISLTKGEEERMKKTDVTTSDDIENPTKTKTKMPVKEAEKEDEAENEPNRKARKEETVGAPSSQPVKYYLKHRINEKLIEGLVDNHRGPVYEAILRKKITRKEDIRGNFKIPCNIGGMKHMNALIDQRSDVNVIPCSTYIKLTDERPAETDIRLSLASHPYIYPLEIAEDILVKVAEHVYPVDFVILDIKEDEKRPFILGTSFLTTAKAIIKFDNHNSKIITVNVIPLDHVDDVPVVEPNQHDDVPVVPEPILADEEENLEEEEFEVEEEPQEEEEDDMEVDIEEDENEPELTYPFEEVDPLNPLSPASELEPEDVIEVENTIEYEDETVLSSVHEVSESSTTLFLREDSDGLLHGLMRSDINSLFGRMDSLSRRLCGRETAHALVEKKGKAKGEYYGKLILDLGNEVRSSMEQGTAAMEKLVEKLGNAGEKAECKKLKKELKEARGFVFEERPNEAIDVPIKDEKSPSSGPVRGQDAAPVVHECTFARFMKCNPTIFHGTERAVELQRWFEKTESVFGISECAEGKKVKFTAGTLQGPALTWWNAKVATMSLETVNCRS
ncbi:putative reverse transcriptase domain-containing protein [Tanacetum coccineum]